MSWTDERVEDLKRLWADGLSASIIAKQLGGTTRNAVLGKVWRLGIAGRDLPSPAMRVRTGAAAKSPRAREDHVWREGGKPKTAKAKKAPKPRLNNLVGVNTARRARSPQGSEAVELPRLLVDASFARPWIERGPGQCAYPISGEGADTFSCCAPTAATYCKAHAAVMFKPIPAEDNKRLLRLARVA